jgi:hypothetical protein
MPARDLWQKEYLFLFLFVFTAVHPEPVVLKTYNRLQPYLKPVVLSEKKAIGSIQWCNQGNSIRWKQDLLLQCAAKVKKTNLVFFLHIKTHW